MTIEGKFLKEKRNEGTAFYEDIDSLCRKHTSLSESDIQTIHEYACRLPEKARSMGRDCFINCVRTLGNDSVTVAAAYASNSLYNYSTVGAIVSDMDEPAVLRTLRFGLASNDIHARSYTTTEGNNIIQDCYPIKNNGKVIGVIIIERDMTKEDFDEWERLFTIHLI